MVFLTHTDTDNYYGIGQEFAASGCNLLEYPSPLRPIGSMLHHAIPFLITKDTVLIEYIAFYLNLFFFVLAIVALSKILSHVLAKLYDTQVPLYFIATALAFIMYGSHIPIRSVDLQAGSLFLFAFSMILDMIDNSESKKAISPTKLFMILSLISMSGLYKQSWFIYGYAALFLGFLFMHKSTLKQFILDYKFYLIIFLGSWGLLLQFSYIYYHFDDFWFFQKGAMPGPKLIINNLIAYNLPMQSAYVLNIESDNAVKILLYKLYFAFYEFSSLLYKGYAPHLDVTFYTSQRTNILVALYLLVLFAIIILSWLVGSKKIKFISTLIVFMSIFTLLTLHIESRYYIVPKLLILILTIFLAFKVFKVNKKMFLILVGSTLLFFLILMNIFSGWIENENRKNLLNVKQTYIYSQFEYVKEQQNVIECLPERLPLTYGHQSLANIESDNIDQKLIDQLNIIIFENQKIIDQNQKIIENCQK